MSSSAPGLVTPASTSSSQARTDSSCWPSSGGAACASGASPSNRSGGPGSVTRPASGVLDVDEQPLGPGLLPVVDPVEGAHLAGRDADRREPGQQVGERVRREGLVDRARSRRPGCAPGPRWWRTAGRRRAGRARQPAAATGSRCRPRSAADRRRRGTARTGRSTGGGCPARTAPRPRRCTACPGTRARRRSRPAARCARPCRRPVRSRSCRAAATPYAPYIPASRSPIGTPTRIGSSGPVPVSDIRPASPCAIWSYPARPPSGPSWPKPVIDRTTRRGFSSCSRSTGKPSRSSTPVRKFSTSTSACRTSRVSSSLPSSDLRSAVTDSLLRLQEKKYVLSPLSATPSAPTNGGPQPRLSSPPSGFSTLMTRAPRSPSIIAACGPARARERSTTSTPSKGPCMGPG